MTNTVRTPADVANLALARMGYRLRVGSLYDGSAAAVKFLDIYGQTRDELLRASDWDFAERNVDLTLLKSAPPGGYVPPTVWDGSVNPPIGWLYEYALPDDYLKVRAVKPTPLFFPNLDPQPYVYSIANDEFFSPPLRVILCNVKDAVMVYTGQVTDPASWDVGFTEAFAAALARRLAPLLVGLEAAKLIFQDEAMSTAQAEGEQG